LSSLTAADGTLVSCAHAGVAVVKNVASEAEAKSLHMYVIYIPIFIALRFFTMVHPQIWIC
jgi:hypothetical protein